MIFKKAALALAVMGAATSASALEEANPFFDDASLDLKFKTLYVMQEEDANAGKGYIKYNDVLLQGIGTYFKSGFLMDMVGVDLAMHNAFGIITHDGEGGRGTDGKLGNSSSDDDYQNNDITDFSAAVKFKLGDYGTLKYGKFRVSTPLYIDSTNGGGVPELTEAAQLKLSFGDLNTHAYRLSKGYSKASDVEEQFEEPVYLVGGSYTFSNDLWVGLDYGRQKNHTEQFYARGYFPISIGDDTLSLTGHYYRPSAIGDSKGKFVEDSLDIWGAKVGYAHGPLYLSAAYAKVDGIYTDWDQMIWKGGNKNGGSHVITDTAMWYCTDWSEMDSYLVSVSYDLDEYVEGLYVGVKHMWGSSDYEDRDVKMTTISAGYNVPSVDNLGFWIGYGMDSDTYDSKTWGYNDLDSNYLWAEMSYKFSAF